MLNDLFILTKIKEGNVKAFEQVFRLYYTPLCLYSASITGKMDSAEEIVQELFYVFWKERATLQIFHSIKSYLYGAVRNQSLQFCEHEEVKQRYNELFMIGRHNINQIIVHTFTQSISVRLAFDGRIALDFVSLLCIITLIKPKMMDAAFCCYLFIGQRDIIP